MAEEAKNEGLERPAAATRRAGWKAPLLAVLFFGTTCGAGWFYYQLTLKQRGTAAVAETARSDAEREKGRAESAEAANVACKKERDVQAGARADTEKSAADARSQLSATRAELESLQGQRAETEERLQAFQMLTARFQKMIDAGKLKITIQNGRMVVKLPERILFASGQAELAKDGIASMREIAQALRQVPDRSFMVAGHTDPIPAGGKFKSNWELSTARAVTVTEALIAGGMNAARLVPAGYGPYNPIASNSSEAGRAENRRIEIVLLPKLQELPPLSPEATASASPAAGKPPDK